MLENLFAGLFRLYGSGDSKETLRSVEQQLDRGSEYEN